MPASDRFALKYSGYHFTISNKEIGVRLQRISRACDSDRRWYDFKEKLHETIRDNILLNLTVVILGTIFIIAVLPIKPFVDVYRKMKLAARRKAEEAAR